MMATSRARAVLFPGALSVLITLSVGAAQRGAESSEMGWVGLYSTALIEWLENENRLDSFCAEFFGNADARDRCRADKLLPRPLVVPLRAGPTLSSKPSGFILLLATPGKGLRFFYVPSIGGSPREFEPDLNMQDWGYGPYFHQTYVERRGDWFLLPADPFPVPTWFNARDLDSEAHTLGVGGIVEGPEGSLVILGVERNVVRARPEQPADMWCESDAPPPLKPWLELRIPRRDLYGPTGHLRISPKYMKGC
jgi:hypothetical protein